jgi:DNA primase
MKILELVEKYGLDVTKQGNLYVTYCPFHKDEHRPNFTIYEETDSYYCYTCSKGGDAIDFFARMEKIPYAQAQHRLYSDLSSLRDKINKVKTPKSYNDVVNLQASKLLRSAVYSQPSRLGEIMQVMMHVDDTLVRDITQDEAINLISEVSSRLNAIAQSV